MKPSSEMSYLYGNHILKSGLGRITEGTTQYQGVVVYSMSDLPLVSCISVCVGVWVCGCVGVGVWLWVYGCVWVCVLP